MGRTSANKRAVVAAVAAVSALSALTACGSDEPSGASASTQDSVDDIAALLPESIAEQGYLTIAASAYAPAVIAPSGSGAPTGWDADLLTEVAGVLGLEPRYKMIPFDGVISGLQADRYDVAVGEIGVNDERLQTVSFVLNHSTADVLMVRADGENQGPFEEDTDVCGMTVGVLVGSQEAGFMNEAAKSCESAGEDTLDVKTFQDQATVNLALAQDRIEANLTTDGTAATVMKQTPDEFVAVAAPWVPVLPTGFALPNNDDVDAMTEAIAAALDHLIEEGDYTEIVGKYIEEDHGAIEKAEIYSTVVDGAKTTT